MTITFKPLTVPTMGFSDMLLESLNDDSGKSQLELTDELISEIAEREGWFPEVAAVVLHRGGQQGMKPGDWFDPAGYEQVASIQGSGEIDPSTYLVLHNNSSHIFVAAKPDQSRGVNHSTNVRLIRSLRYDDLGWQQVYAKALGIAATIAGSEQ